MRRALIAFIAAVFVFIVSVPCLQASIKNPPVSFSAEFVSSIEGEPAERGKYFAGPEGIRTEGVSGGIPFITIYDLSSKVSWLVYPKERKYVEASLADARLGTDDMLSGLAVGTPCAAVNFKGTQLGMDKLQGRDVQKWSCANPAGEKFKVWFDNRLKVSIRVEAGEDTFELKNIKEGVLSKDLFRPPAGFTK